jgi:hypothetical protein
LLFSVVVSAIAVAANAREAITASKARIFIWYLVSGRLCPSRPYKRSADEKPLAYFKQSKANSYCRSRGSNK